MTGTEPDLQLRPASAGDADLLVDVLVRSRRAAVPVLPPPACGEQETRTRLASASADPQRELWVAWLGGAPVGLVCLTATWLEDLYVDPGHQRRGVGSALLDLARARRPRGFGLWVLVSNVSARHLYRRHGLVELETTDGSATEEGEPDVRVVWPGEQPLAYLRDAIDEVDDELAELLARRTALTAAVQEHKSASRGPSGLRGRDEAREAEIVRRMSRHAPGLEPARLARVMATLIAESLAQWEQRGTAPPSRTPGD